MIKRTATLLVSLAACSLTLFSVSAAAHPGGHLCHQSADPGRPAGEPFVKPSRVTELISGLYLNGGPLRTSPHCRHGVPAAGTITVTDPTTGTTVARETVRAGKLAKFRLAPGTYTIEGTFATAYRGNQHMTARPRTVTIAAHATVRDDLEAAIR